MTVSTRRAAPALPCILLLLAACQAPPGLPANTARAMREVVTRYETASNDGDAEALSALYADDAVVMPPDGGVVSGHDAILAFWKDGIEPGISFQVVESHTEGSTGYVAGRFLMEATETAPADSGKYVLCLRRQQDGAWRVTADIWNATPSADETDDEENADPRTHVTSAGYHLITMDHRATKSRRVEPQPTTLQRVKTALRNSSRVSSRRSSRH
jgi:uncharacterized protein (TIGR02246 family)